MRSPEGGWASSVVTLVAATMLPILAVAAVQGLVLIGRERDAREEEFRASARALLHLVDEELRNNMELAAQLASSPALRRGDLEGFAETARWLLQGRESWLAVALHDPATSHEMYSSRPDLVIAGQTGGIGRAAEGRIIVEPMVSGRSDPGQSFVPIRAPAMIDGTVRYVVSTAILPTRFLELLERPIAAEHLLAAIVDPAGIVVARSDGMFTGHRSRTAGQQQGATSIQEGPGRDGNAHVRAIVRSDETGWRLALGIPAESFNAPLRHKSWLIALLGLVAAAMSAIVAVLLVRNIARRMAHARMGVEEELRVNHERLLTAFALREMVVADYDPDFRYTWIHDSAFGRDSGQVVGRTDHDFFDEPSADQLLALYREARDNQTEGWAELALRHKGEIKLRHFDVVVAPRFGRDGQFQGLTCAFLSIDEEIDIRERLEAAVAAAGRADLAKSRFLASASHDLRQPFQAMRLYHHVLEIRAADSKSRQALDALGRAMTAGEELLTALLDVSTLEAGTVRPVFEPISVAEMLQEVAAEYGEIASQRALRFTTMPIRASVTSDRVLLKRIVRNLVNNALRYTERGGILLGARRRGQHVLIQVWDTGKGIPADRLQDIFEDFYQLDNPSRDRSRGLGLGLSIVQRTVRLLGHDITVSSRLGRGSVFTIWVPVAKDEGEKPRRLSVVQA